MELIPSFVKRLKKKWLKTFIQPGLITFTCVDEVIFPSYKYNISWIVCIVWKNNLKERDVLKSCAFFMSKKFRRNFRFERSAPYDSAWPDNNNLSLMMLSFQLGNKTSLNLVHCLLSDRELGQGYINWNWRFWTFSTVAPYPGNYLLRNLGTTSSCLEEMKAKCWKTDSTWPDNTNLSWMKLSFGLGMK